MRRHSSAHVLRLLPTTICLAWLLLLLPAASRAGAGVPSICHSDKVEFIIGGTAQMVCSDTARPRATGARAVTSGGIGTRMTISAADQQQRDQDRQAILEQELQQEQQQLAAQLRAGSGADSAALNRTRSNVLALQRELGRGAP